MSLVLCTCTWFSCGFKMESTTCEWPLLSARRSCCTYLDWVGNVTFGDEGKADADAIATHGSIGEFQGNAEGWTTYIERLECYFTANNVATDKKRRAILLACCGPATYSLICSLAAPHKPTEVPYKDLGELVQSHYNPRPSQIVQRFKFNSRTQQPGESIASYIAELLRLSEHCGYGQALDKMLRDCLVCGLAYSYLNELAKRQWKNWRLWIGFFQHIEDGSRTKANSSTRKRKVA